MKPKSTEIFIPGPAGRLEAKYYKNPKFGSPVAIVLQPHPQYGGTMNNKIVQLAYNIFLENGFSVIKLNFRGVGKSDGIFDNGQGELSDAAAALDWVERENLDYSQCWVSGFSFGALICMQLIMRRPEVNNFIAISPQPNVYDFSFLAPCPTSGLVVYSEIDELVTKESIEELDKRIKNQKGVEVIFAKIEKANHFFKEKEKELSQIIKKYIKEKTALI
ncbi:alpha/beta hydrolase [Pelagibacteraceae bacterium]|jgi:alpha/beta superfamily hydrolase|nr:alpha/beta hydrolase [Pelagibacteraceae bacterium]